MNDFVLKIENISKRYKLGSIGSAHESLWKVGKI